MFGDKMIKLENIYVKEIFDSIKDDRIFKLILDNNAYSVADVVMLINNYPEYDWSSVIRKINDILDKIDMYNARGNEAIVYRTNGYSDNKLYITDTMNIGEILPLYSVTNVNPVNYFGVKDKTIKLIKEQLLHTTISGENYFKYSNGKIGNVKVQKMVDAIKMYEEQVERQSLTTNNKDQNLFLLDQSKKMAIVNENLSIIVLYFFKNAKKEMVWGRLSDQMKRELISCTINDTLKDKMIRKNLVTYISNFVTLPELKSENEEVFNRFILK